MMMGTPGAAARTRSKVAKPWLSGSERSSSDGVDGLAVGEPFEAEIEALHPFGLESRLRLRQQLADEARIAGVVLDEQDPQRTRGRRVAVDGAGLR